MSVGSMASSEVATILCLILAVQFGAHVSELSTDPPTENGGTTVVAALENATNVSVFCAVTEFGNATLTAWYLTEEGGTRQRIQFGQQCAANFLETGAGNANLTILLFGRNLDMARLECNNGLNPPNREVAFFSLRIIG